MGIRLLRPEQVAQALGIGKTKTYMLIASGKLPSVKIGGSVRVPLDALEKWLAERTRTAEA